MKFLKDVSEVDALILKSKELNNSVPEYRKVRFPRLNFGLGGYTCHVLGVVSIFRLFVL